MSSPEAHNARRTFFPRSEVVGWTQGFHGSNGGSHGRSIGVSGLVVGRELRGVVSSDNIKLRVQTYVKVTGNEYPLRLLPNAKPHEGLSGFEFEITDDFSPKYALTLSYSQTEPVKLEEGHITTLASIAKNHDLREYFVDMQGNHIVHLPRPDLPLLSLAAQGRFSNSG